MNNTDRRERAVGDHIEVAFAVEDEEKKK